jgi:hypothetical protein
MKYFKVKFKEIYMDTPVIREAQVYDLNKLIEIYELNNEDIEYWEILEERTVE